MVPYSIHGGERRRERRAGPRAGLSSSPDERASPSAARPRARPHTKSRESVGEWETGEGVVEFHEK